MDTETKELRHNMSDLTLSGVIIDNAAQYLHSMLRSLFGISDWIMELLVGLW